MSKVNISVAKYLEQQIAIRGKPQREIAQELGYTNPNIITMMKIGSTKVPINKIGPLARSLGVDPVFFFNLVMGEYYPETLEAIEKVLPPERLISEDTYRLIGIVNEATDGTPIDWTLARNVVPLRECINQIAQSERAANEASLALYNSKPRNAKDR